MASKQTGSIDMNTYAEAAGKATHYVTEQASGIFVHPEDDMLNGVSIQDTIEIIRNGDSVAEFGEEIRLGKAGESAQANFSAAGMQFKNESGDTIAKMLSTDASIGTIDAEDGYTTQILNEPTRYIISGNNIYLASFTVPLNNLVYSTGAKISWYIEVTFLAFYSDTTYPPKPNYTPSASWYHLDNNGNVTTASFGNNAGSYIQLSGSMTYPETTSTLTTTVTLVQNDIVNGNRVPTNLHNTSLYTQVQYNGDSIIITITMPTSNNGVLLNTYKRGVATRSNCKKISVTTRFPANAGYAPEYVFGLKKAGQDPQAYAFIAGEQNYANAQHQAIFGKFNDPDSNHAFEIGNGTDDENRSNAFSVDWNGNVEANNLVTNVAYNSTTKALTKTINNVTSNIVALSTLADALEPLITGLVYKGAITAFNDAQTGGYYTYASSATNRPPLNAGGTCLVLKNGNFVTQICFPNRSSQTATPTFYIRRTYAANSWQAWYQIVPTAPS